MEDARVESVSCVLGERVDVVGWRVEACAVVAELDDDVRVAVVESGGDVESSG